MQLSCSACPFNSNSPVAIQTGGAVCIFYGDATILGGSRLHTNHASLASRFSSCVSSLC